MIRYMILTNHFAPAFDRSHTTYIYVLPEQLRFSLGKQIIFNYYNNNRILGELLYNYSRWYYYG